MQASDVFARVGYTLVDTAHVRWGLAELQLYLTDGLQALAIVRPEAVTKTTEVALEAGARQSLPAYADLLLSIEGAGAKVQKAVPYVDVDVLDRFRPGWRGEPPVLIPDNYTYDAKSPREYYVYPPAKAGATVALRYIAIPERVSDPEQALGVADGYLPALTDYVLYRCFAKDADDPGSLQRAMTHLELFNTATGGKLKMAQTRKPRANQPPDRGLS